MRMVRAGVVSGRRALLYGSLAVLAIVAVCGGFVGAFGLNRVVTGLFMGLIAGITLLVALFGRDVVLLTDRAIYCRTPWAETSIDWDRVVAGRFALDERARWSLALDLSGGDERHGELVLLNIPPVIRPISNAFEHRKREQVVQIRTMLREKRVPVTILPEIARALHEHWKLAPPVH
ncbi:hypothetical protein NDR87_24795 [Nocardia sp. CDC159]|uniref:PH (Pleckstrin Homology) domain-containing protein n=1 Tax=Nocardia pulmonis TaxID=2951408 RepID=A0A9X2E6C2_9NOCA|nr:MULTISPECIES: hypothetical protein [Nocardia]MCM6775122.1 hypothetical protein [Nocardia pulmonis]MCM6789592.1 hypothetical protein [Nocardia sp. CDC159]